MDPATFRTIPRGCSLIELAPPNAENIVLAYSKPGLHSTSGNPAFFGEVSQYRAILLFRQDPPFKLSPKPPATPAHATRIEAFGGVLPKPL